MTKKERLTMSGCLYTAGVLIVVYGAGFSWRQALIGALALLSKRTPYPSGDGY